MVHALTSLGLQLLVRLGWMPSGNTSHSIASSMKNGLLVVYVLFSIWAVVASSVKVSGYVGKSAKEHEDGHVGVHHVEVDRLVHRVQERNPWHRC
jgi:hypothetical protein